MWIHILDMARTREMTPAHLHFVHHRRYDNDATPAVSKWVFPPRNRNAVLRCVCISINDMVFRADEYTRRAIEALG
jgi:hypothetical protein